MIDAILIDLSNNKLFTGCLMLMTNIGGRYLGLELPNNIEKLFSEYFILRCLVIFSIFFMATRDIKISLLLSLLFFIIVKYFISEKSSFCVIKEKEKEMNLINNNNNSNRKISEEEYKKAKEIVIKYYEDSNKMRNIS